MKKKTNLKLLMMFTVVICLLSFVFEATAQQRKRRPARRAKSTATTPAPPAASLEVKDGSQKVSTQIKNVSKFVYVLGGIAKNIEAIDADIKARRTTRRETIDQNERAKQTVVASIKNLQEGLAPIEIEFRTKNGLRPYLSQISGVTEMTGQAADQAAAGQLTESGKTLLMVIEKLTDTLAALP